MFEGNGDFINFWFEKIWDDREILYLCALLSD